MLIVGGGPVGLSAALELARQGVPSLLVERNATTADHPRASVVNTRTAELARAWAVLDGVYAESLEPKADLGITWTTRLAGHELGRILLVEDPERAIAEFGVSPVIPAVCAQDRLEPILRRRAEALPLPDLRFAHELVALEDLGERVHAVVRSAGGELAVSCDWVIAADGAHSPSRDRLGVGLEGTGALAHQINIHFRLDLSPWSQGRPSLLFYVANPDVAGFMIALDGRERWLLNVPYRPDAGGLASQCETERCRALVRDAVGADVDPEIVSVQPWTVTAQVAERYRVGRVLLAGDAAHRFPPTGGFGMNTGIQDAHNLAWKLAAVLRGAAAGRLLDTYDAERRPVAVFNSEQSLKNGLGLADTGIPFAREGLDLAEIEGDDEPGRALRARIAARIPEQREHFDFRGQELGFAYASDAVIDDGSPPAPFDVQVYTPTGRPGARAPHLWARRGGEELSTLDLFGWGFCLLTGPRGDGWVAAAAALDGVTAVRFGVDLEGDADDFERQYGVEADGAVLVRPDGHVGWRSAGGSADGREELWAAVDSVLGKEAVGRGEPAVGGLGGLGPKPGPRSPLPRQGSLSVSLTT